MGGRRGMLVFKGDKKNDAATAGPKKKKNKAKHSLTNDSGDGIPHKSADHDQIDNNSSSNNNNNSNNNATAHMVAIPPTASAPLPSLDAAPENNTTSSTEATAPQVLLGTGKITTSGTVVTGYGTVFERELSVGDAILVGLGTPQQEMRIVTMRLSNVSLNLSSALVYNKLKTPTSFHYMAKPRNRNLEARLAAQQAQMTQLEQEELSLGTFKGQAGGAELVYREKTEHGSYRIKRETLQQQQQQNQTQVTRSDLLDIRSKRTSDKYC